MYLHESEVHYVACKGELESILRVKN